MGNVQSRMNTKSHFEVEVLIGKSKKGELQFIHMQVEQKMVCLLLVLTRFSWWFT